MKKVLALSPIALVTLALPLVSLAATLNNLEDVGGFIINTINGVFVPLIFAISFAVFVWGAFKTFILGAASDFDKEKGKNLMLYGITGFVVMGSVWGLVALVTNTLNIGGTTGPGNLPGANFNIR